MALNAKGIQPQEVAGCAQVLQRKHTPIAVRGPLLDTCGTGGDGLGTFNISSLTALVAAQLRRSRGQAWKPCREQSQRKRRLLPRLGDQH